MNEPQVPCCFCAKRIRVTEEEAIECAVHFKDGSSQALWCQVDCLGSRLHAGVPWLSLEDRQDPHE